MPARLEQVPNIGPAIAAKLRRIGIGTPAELAGREPYALFAELEARSGERHDLCLLDVLIAAQDFLGGAPQRPWWAYTAQRKQRLNGRRPGAAGIAVP